MAKKQQKETPAPGPHTPVVNRDALQRLNYLHQASVMLAAVLPPARQAGSRKEHSGGKGQTRASEQRQGEAGAGRERREGTSEVELDQAGQAKSNRKHKRSQNGTAEALQPVSRHLAKEMVEVAKKATVRMDPSVKRTKCKGCGGVLVAGVTSQVRIKPSGPHGHLIVHTCLSCHSQRRLPAPPHLPPPAATDVSLDLSVVAPPPPRSETKREKREARQARPPAFFEREGHVTIAGDRVLARDEYGEAA
ncbi:hypothetical protein JCM10213_007360 [Rhodosporidiobolus nylandii]